MAVRISTTEYVWTHGHTPRQGRMDPTSPWAFQLDEDPTRVVCITAAYKDALRQAKAQAQYTVTVVP